MAANDQSEKDAMDRWTGALKSAAGGDLCKVAELLHSGDPIPVVARIFLAELFDPKENLMPVRAKVERNPKFFTKIKRREDRKFRIRLHTLIRLVTGCSYEAAAVQLGDWLGIDEQAVKKSMKLRSEERLDRIDMLKATNGAVAQLMRMSPDELTQLSDRFFELMAAGMAMEEAAEAALSERE